MTTVHGDLFDIAGFRGDGVARIRSTVSRPSQTTTGLVTGAWHDFPIEAGTLAMADLDPGPAELRISMGGWWEKWAVTVPDTDEAITLATLLDAYVEYDPAIVGQAQSARDAAVAAAGVADGHAAAAAGSAAAAAAAYAALTDDIENAADAIRAEVDDDAAAAVAARDSAVAAAGTATTQAGLATTRAGEAATSAAAAATRAGEAAMSAAAAEDARMEAVEAADHAGGYVLTASADAATATTQAGIATARATQAAGHAGDAESSRLAAEDARDDVLYARGQAEASAVTATTQAGIATTRATEATTAKNEAVAARSAAQAAAASFGLSAGTVTTGSPSSSASVSVTGAGPAYTLNFTIPRGAQGLQGPQGTGLQIQNRLATYALLPTGLGSGDAGKAWIVDADGLLYIWNGTAFPVSGDGLNLVGARGNDGLTAYQVAQSNGFVGSASEWLDSLVGDPGSAGLSAYEIAQAAGFVGSESAWLDSLKGADGATEWDALANKPTVFPPVIGTGAADAKAGDWMPQWSDVKSKPSTYPPTIGPGATQAAAGNDPRLSDARTPTDHDASKVTSGTLDAARIPSITSAMITDGTIVDGDISPAAAIARTKLDASTQTSLGKADTASQLVITKVANEAAWNSGPKTAGVLYYWTA